MTVAAYPYSAVPSTLVPGARRKLRHPRFLVLASALLGVLVVVITAAAVLSRPTPTFCHFLCGPNTGPRLLSPSAYVSSTYGYRVEYDASQVQISRKTLSGVDLIVQGADPQLVHLDYAATRSSDVSGALQAALDGIDTNTIQDLTQIGAIPGAEIGEVQATGYAFQADYVPAGGGQSAPVDVMALAATQGGVTISVLAVGPKNQSGGAAPFFLNQAVAQLFEMSLGGTVWPGQG